MTLSAPAEHGHDERALRLCAIIAFNGGKPLRCGGYTLIPVSRGYELKGALIHAHFDEEFHVTSVSAPGKFVKDLNEGKTLTDPETRTAMESTWSDIEDQEEALQYAARNLDRFIALAEQQRGSQAQSGKEEVATSIRATRASLYSGKIGFERMNAELDMMVTAVLEKMLKQKQINWFSKERITEIKEFIMRTAKQRCWDETSMEKAAAEILEALNFSGDLRTSKIMNRVSRMLEEAVADIF